MPGYWNVIEENALQWSKDITVGPFWTKVNQNLPRWETQYRSEKNAALLQHGVLKGFEAKSGESIRSKVLRKCRGNPDGIEDIIPSTGPPVPCISDLVRTRIVCKYIDGVEFLSTKISELARDERCLVKRSREGRLEGYFAQHIDLDQTVLFRVDGRGTMTNVRCELQIATQLATHVWDGGHFVYEQEREDPEEPSKWQWAPTDQRFIANQLGHMLHLADGLLLQLRDKPRARK
jgi:hypothetical protein